MGIKIKNLQTGEFEKFNIPALKGEKGEPGEVEPSEKVDYIGKQHSKLRDTMNANVDYIIKTAIGEFNYLDCEGQHITALDTLEGQAKSAILKGQTLVNIVNSDNWVQETANNKLFTQNISIKNGQTYTVIGKIEESDVVDETYLDRAFRIRAGTDNTGTSLVHIGRIDGVIKQTFINNENDTIHIRFFNQKTNYKKLMIIEGDHTQEDIPYFEGMQSVKMPVLKTTGKNLFDKEAFYNDWKSKQPTYMYKEIVDGEEVLKINNLELLWADNKGFKIPVEKGIPLTLTLKCKKAGSTSTNAILLVRYGDSSASTVGRCLSYNWTSVGTTFTPTRDYITICSAYNHNDYYYIKDIQLEKGTAATPYEPYKSNILTVNEPIELRGIGDVQDTLDCLTGEVVERIGEVVLDGSEEWKLSGTSVQGYLAFWTRDLFYTKNELCLCDAFHSLAFSNWSSGTAKDFITYNTSLNDVCIRLSASKIQSNTVDSFKKWLSENPVTVQYELATPIIKTVDLSDNHVYSYKGTTHYDCSSAEGSLVPTLSVKVPTDTQLTIQEQKATTQTLLVKNMDLQQSIKEVQAMNLAFNTALYNSFNSIREEVEDIKKHVSTNENLEGSF